MSAKMELVALFEELTELLALAEGGSQTFRVRAYENATEAIRGTSEALEEMTVSKLTKLDGIGKSTAQKIREYYDTGSIGRLNELRELYPAEFVLLTRIPGLGPKTLLRLRDELDVHNLEDLKNAIAEQKVRALKGMGAKSEEKLAKAIERIGSKQDRRPIAEALPLAETLVQELSKLPQVEKAQFAGSLRRFRETIADIDIVVASTDPSPIMEYFVGMKRVAEVLGRGDTKSSVVTEVGIQVDLRIVAPEQYGAALMYFTGSKTHNIRLRQRALDRGATLNEYGLVELGTDEILASETEEDIYKALDMSWIPPQLREDVGEVESAASDELPELVAVEDLRGDLHVHTDYSGDAKSTVGEMVETAHARGYEYVAITDHGYELRGNGIDEAAHDEIAASLASLRTKYPSMLLLHGCELNIGKEGELDYDDERRASFDICLGSIHTHFDLERTSQTKRLITAIERPEVRILGHMLGRRIGKRPGVECDVDAVLKATVANDVAVEVNSGLHRLDAPADILRRAVKLGCKFVINSDAHHANHMEGIRFGVLHSHRGWLPKELVINTWPRKQFEAWLQRA